MSEDSTIWTLNIDEAAADAGFARLEEMIANFNAQLEEAAATAEESVASLDDALASIGEAADTAAPALDDLAVSMDTIAASSDAVAGASPEAAAGLDEVAASADAAAASMDGAAAANDAAGASLGELNFGPLGAMGLAAVVAGGALVKMGADGGDALQRVQALTGASDAQMADYTANIQQMSGEFGKSVSSMAGGLYDIVSVGYQGSDALTTLKVASQAAAAGGVDLHTVTSGLTSIMKAYGVQGKDAATVMDTLLLGVRDGKASFEDYSNAIGLVATSAKGAGFSLNESAAALSTLTAVFPNARRAGMDLQHLMTTLGVNQAAVAANAKKMGLSFDAAKFSSDNLQGRLEYLQQITHGNQAEMLKLTGGTAGYAAAQVLLNNGSADFTRNMKDMANKTGSTQKAFDSWHKSIGAHAEDMVGSLSSLAEEFTTLAGPQIIGGLDALAGMFAGLASWLSKIDFHSDTTRAVLIVLAGVIGGVLVFALTAAAIAAWGFLAPILIAAAPFILIGLAVGVVAAGIYLLITHWKQLSAWLSSEWASVSSAVGGAFSALGTAVSGVWNTIVTAFNDFIAQQVALGAAIVNGVVGMWNGIKQAFTNAKNLVVGLVTGFAHDIVAGFLWLYDHNYYVHNLVVGIQREFTWIKTTAQAIWHDFTALLAAEWALITKIASTVFNDVKATVESDWKLIETYIIEPVQHAVTAIEQHLTDAKNWLTHLWTDIERDVDKAWTSFVSSITGQSSKVSDGVHTSVVQPIMDALTKAFMWIQQAGGKLMDMLVDGIKSRIGNIRSAVGDVAKNIASFLGFHSPTDEGPGSTADRWMPAFGDLLVEGLAQQVARVRQQALAIASAVQTGVTSASAALGGVNVNNGANTNSFVAPTAPAPSFAADGLYATSAGLNLGGGTNPALLAVLSQLAQSLARQPALGASPVPANLGGVTQQFYGSQFNGVSDLNALYQQLNTLAGIAIENGARGATAGLGL